MKIDFECWQIFRFYFSTFPSPASEDAARRVHSFLLFFLLFSAHSQINTQSADALHFVLLPLHLVALLFLAFISILSTAVEKESSDSLSLARLLCYLI